MRHRLSNCPACHSHGKVLKPDHKGRQFWQDCAPCEGTGFVRTFQPLPALSWWIPVSTFYAKLRS